MSNNRVDEHPSLIVQGGRVIDPAEGIDADLDVSVSDGKIARVGTHRRPAGTLLLRPRVLLLSDYVLANCQAKMSA